MIIEINLNKLEYLKEKSKSNYNYYFLNFKIDNCDIILQECDEQTGDLRYILGTFENDNFIKKRYVNIPFLREEHYNVFNFDDELLDKKWWL
jgi:hypothetical protein